MLQCRRQYRTEAFYFPKPSTDSSTASRFHRVARYFCRPVYSQKVLAWSRARRRVEAEKKRGLKLYIEEKGILDLLDHVRPLHHLRPIQTNGRMNDPWRKNDSRWRWVEGSRLKTEGDGKQGNDECGGRLGTRGGDRGKLRNGSSD